MATLGFHSHTLLTMTSLSRHATPLFLKLFWNDPSFGLTPYLVMFLWTRAVCIPSLWPASLSLCLIGSFWSQDLGGRCSPQHLIQVSIVGAYFTFSCTEKGCVFAFPSPSPICLFLSTNCQLVYMEEPQGHDLSSRPQEINLCICAIIIKFINP